MSRLSTIQPAEATGKAKELLTAVRAKLGLVPNMTKVMANSPAVLEGYLGFSGALASGLLSRGGHSADARADAALTLARRVLATRGDIDASDLAAVRQAGLSDGEIAEVVAHVALNVFTNYFNKAAEVDIDFPRVSFSNLG